jgi:hypothetical protein
MTSAVKEKIDVLIDKQMVFLSNVDDKIDHRIGNTE